MTINQKQQTSYIYLLVESGKKAFKIGKADDVLARAAILPQEFEDSIYFECEQHRVFDIEKVLHYMFKTAHQPKESGDGRTEWFDYQYFNECKQFIIQNQEQLGITQIIETTKNQFYKTPESLLEQEKQQKKLWIKLKNNNGFKLKTVNPSNACNKP